MPRLLVPLLDKAGRKQQANTLFTKVFQRCEELCTDYPRWAAAHRCLADLAASCHRELGQALIHAQKAVDLDPKSPRLLGTLAEVHFQRGDQAKAVELIGQCIKLDPQREIWRKRLNRFEAAERDSPPP
jgi:tetratricopeptide (TPR) repeat protein